MNKQKVQYQQLLTGIYFHIQLSSYHTPDSTYFSGHVAGKITKYFSASLLNLSRRVEGRPRLPDHTDKTNEPTTNASLTTSKVFKRRHWMKSAVVNWLSKGADIIHKYFKNGKRNSQLRSHHQQQPQWS